MTRFFEHVESHDHKFTNSMADVLMCFDVYTMHKHAHNCKCMRMHTHLQTDMHADICIYYIIQGSFADRNSECTAERLQFRA